MHHFIQQSLLDSSPYMYRHTYLLYENIALFIHLSNVVSADLHYSS